MKDGDGSSLTIPVHYKEEFKAHRSSLQSVYEGKTKIFLIFVFTTIISFFCYENKIQINVTLTVDRQQSFQHDSESSNSQKYLNVEIIDRYVAQFSMQVSVSTMMNNRLQFERVGQEGFCVRDYVSKKMSFRHL